MNIVRRLNIFAPVDFRVSVQSNNDIVAMFTHLRGFNNQKQYGCERGLIKHDPNDERKFENFFEEVKVADVEKVEGSGNIDNLLAKLGAFAVGKLEGELPHRQCKEYKWAR